MVQESDGIGLAATNTYDKINRLLSNAQAGCVTVCRFSDHVTLKILASATSEERMKQTRYSDDQIVWTFSGSGYSAGGEALLYWSR